MTPDRWNPAKSMPWEIIRVEWLARWQEAVSERPEARILIEKSPPNLVRAKQIEEEFAGVKFILLMRDPYPWCASFACTSAATGVC
jgi:hypothetical protein